MVEALRMIIRRPDLPSESEICIIPADLLYLIMRAREKASRAANQQNWRTPTSDNVDGAIRDLWALEAGLVTSSGTPRRLWPPRR